ncbi:MAG: MFS transporter [Acidimicrobiales bacterium]
MPRTERTLTLDEPALDARCRPRDGLVLERLGCEEATADGGRRLVFEGVDGPCPRYRRTVEIAPAPAADGRRTAVEQLDYDLPVPFWGWLVRPVFGFELRRRGDRRGQPWWAPPQRLQPHQVDALCRLVILAICSGYVGTLLSQLTTFAGREFGAGVDAQAAAQAATRIGVLVALVGAFAADRIGRRRTLLVGLVGACLVTALTGLATGLVAFAAVQVVARGLTTGSDVVRAVIVAEVMPAGARAYAISLSAMCAGLGSGMAVWLLPLADLDERAWRLLFGLGAVFAPLAWLAGRGLQESGRFVAHRHDQRPQRLGAHRGRLALLAASALLTTLFAAPASQLQNEYLRTDRGFSAGAITAFTLLTSTPAGVAVFFGGRLADVYGRRVIGAIGLVGGAAGITVSYTAGGATLWGGAVAGTLFGGLVVPTLVIYGPELFPTRLRGRANGVITTAGVLGSVCGLLLVGNLADRFGFGAAMPTVACGPVLVAVLVLTRYPETAQRELEELNPSDAAAGPAPDRSPIHPGDGADRYG